jgi:23S rRNA (cytidine1920-2'-O)/16S rRNA (cytidine1409-2'-O)-methyltransferase
MEHKLEPLVQGEEKPKKKKKMRLDAYLTEEGYFESRAKAQAAIMAGQILVDDQKVDKPGTPVKEGAKIRLLGEKLRYVSRGGLKLEKALQVFPLSVAGKVMADIGASTGGFTDCALQNGAVRVYAIDVGYGQLAWKLRTDPRVVNMERTNARLLDETSLPEPVDAASIDVAFISLEKILPAVHRILAPDGFILALVKPQFEAGKENIGKKGVVRDPAVHRDVLHRVLAFAKAEGFGIGGLDFSPVKGPEGNIEYLLYLTTEPGLPDVVSPEEVDTLVSRVSRHVGCMKG